MAGKVCPSCGKQTVFANNEGLACTKCDFKVILATPKGRGRKCIVCGKFQIFNDVCKSCGAKYSF